MFRMMKSKGKHNGLQKKEKIVKKQDSPNVAVETFLSLVKYFLIVLILNNLIWAGIHFGYYFNSFTGTESYIQQEQSGHDNIQGLDNVSETNG